MDEKKHPLLEEDSVGMACEPVAEIAEPALKPANSVTEVHDWIDDLDWDRFPSFGPFSDEEAIARIKEAEADMNDPSKWIRIDNLHAELKRLHPWL